MTNHRSSPLHRLLIAAALAVTPWVAKAQTTTFYSDIDTANWAAQTWTPDTVPGTTDGSPSTDQVAIDKTTSTAGELRLTENRNIASLTRFRALKDSLGSAIRLVNNNGNNSVKLTIQDLLSVESGYLYLRAHHSYLSARFTVETDRMEIGSTEWNGAVPESVSIGTVYFSGHSGTNDYSRVTLKVNKTLTVIGNGRFIYDGTATGEAEIDFGDVIFRDNVSGGNPLTPTFSLGSAASPEVDHRVKIRSLQSEAAHSSGVSITGGATLELYGNAPTEPADYRFYGEIQETTRLEKTGDNTQILSRSAGNSYSGGTRISAGTLVVENTTGSGLGSGAVTIEGSGAVGGNGRIALAQEEVITVKAGGRLAPGKDGGLFNTLRIVTPTGSSQPTLSMEEDSHFSFTLGANNASDTIEFLNYTPGALALAPGGIGITLEGPLSEGVYQLFVFREGGEGSALVSSGFTDGLYVNHLSDDFHITLHYNDAAFGGAGVIAMEIAAIPEPSSVALLVSGAGFLGLWMARRRLRSAA
ncbi:MAG TPA: autotransporter-associated beta strand repeat-containing protein [Chthoniobacteraceae bacterium]|nr:autotransporter-associated beta strand repeat-containing protein [Chthoniobacteraceae bacterium]